MNDYLSQMTEIDAEYKVILVGDSTIGKTSLFKKITSGIYYDKNVSTIGYDKKTIELEITTKENDQDVKKRINIILTDTAGQERYLAITKSYFTGSNAVLLLYSVVDKKTFNHLNEWMKKIKEMIGNYEDNKYLVFLMGTKSDVVETDESLRQVTEKEAMDFCDKYEIEWFDEWSSKVTTEEKFKELLVKIATKLYETIGYNKIERQTLSTLQKKKVKKNKKNIKISIQKDLIILEKLNRKARVMNFIFLDYVKNVIKDIINDYRSGLKKKEQYGENYYMKIGHYLVNFLLYGNNPNNINSFEEFSQSNFYKNSGL